MSLLVTVAVAVVELRVTVPMTPAPAPLQRVEPVKVGPLKLVELPLGSVVEPLSRVPDGDMALLLVKPLGSIGKETCQRNIWSNKGSLLNKSIA